MQLFNSLIFWTVYGLTYLISLLPLKFLHRVSYIIYLIGWKVLGYRKNIIIQNITRSLPDANYHRVNEIANQYARFLFDMMAEWLKSFTENVKSIRSRIVVQNLDLVPQDEQKNLFLVMGHYGNWENLSFLPSIMNKPVYVVYKRQSSGLAHRLSHKMRGRFGIGLLESKQAVRFILGNKTPSVYVFIADQSPSALSKTTLTFLNQPTRAFDGVARLAQQKKGDVLYLELLPLANHRHRISFKPLNPDQPIINSFFACLEESIQENPSYWLWSHRRWKHRVNPELQD